MNNTTTAPIWRRLAALVYDSLILLAISFLYGAVMTALVAQQNTSTEKYQPMLNSPFYALGWIACLLGFYCWFWHKSGQTIGMRTWRLKLVQKNAAEATPTWGQCTIRSVLAPICNLLFGLGFWYQWFDPNDDCLQDKLTHTQVIVLAKEKQ